MIKKFFQKRDEARYTKDLTSFIERNSLVLQVGGAMLNLYNNNGISGDWVETYNCFLVAYNTGKLYVTCHSKDHPRVKEEAIKLCSELEDLASKLADIRARLLRETK